MLSILACVVVSQTPPVLTAEEVRQKLEYPVTYKTDPVRLPVALDEVGRMVGVRIRCESELQSAVVVVGVKNKPAKEVIQHLVGGIGAGTAIINGTMVVGMGITSPEESARQKDRQIQAIKWAIDNRAKQLKVEEPIDLQSAARTAALIVASMQSSDGSVRPPYQLVQETSQKAPVHRAVVELMRVVGAARLRPEDDRPITLSMRDLDADQAKKARSILGKLESEQSTWAKTFEQVMKLSANGGDGYYFDLLNKSVSVDDSKPDGFSFTVTNNSWGRTVAATILSGSEELFVVLETLPRERIYTNPGGEYFPYSKGAGVKASLGELATKLLNLKRAAQSGNQVVYDANLMRRIADPFRNEPLALTLVKPTAEVAEKLGFNVVAFVGDSLLNSVIYGYYNLQDNQVPGEQVLSLAGNMSGSLRKKGDWLLGYCSNPEAYLESQIDRISLGKFLTKALKPGALTFDQFLAARKEMTSGQMNFARQFARIVRPGFDSLNPVNMEMLELFGALKPGQLAQAESGGIPFGALAPELQNKFRGYISHQRRRQRFAPDDSIDGQPTLQEILSSRIYLARRSRYGMLTLQGADLKKGSYNPYINYSFHDFDRYRGYQSLDQVLPQLNEQVAWLARMDTIGFTVDITRRRSQGFTTSQYITDITTSPLTPVQIGEAITRYFQSGG